MSTSSDWRTCPVDWHEPHAAVVVGVGAAGAHEAAVRWAVAEAERAGRPLTVVTAAPVHDVGQPRGGDIAAWLARAVRQRHPDLVLRQVLELGRPVGHLLNRSVGEALLVVGRREARAFPYAARASTSVAVAGRSRVPVVVVPEDWRADEHLEEPVLVAELPDVDNGKAVAFAAAAAAARHVPLESLSVETADELLAEAAGAQLLVVPRSPAGRFGLPLGSPLRRLVSRTPTPVAVVPSAAL